MKLFSPLPPTPDGAALQEEPQGQATVWGPASRTAHATAPRRGRKVSVPLREQLPCGSAAAESRGDGVVAGLPSAGRGEGRAAARQKVTARGSRARAGAVGRRRRGQEGLAERLRGCGVGGEVWRQLLVKMPVWGSGGGGKHPIALSAPVRPCGEWWRCSRHLALSDWEGAGAAAFRGLPRDGAGKERRCRLAERGELPLRAGRAPLPAESNSRSGGGGQVSGGENLLPAASSLRETPLLAAFSPPGEPQALLPPVPPPGGAGAAAHVGQGGPGLSRARSCAGVRSGVTRKFSQSENVVWSRESEPEGGSGLAINGPAGGGRPGGEAAEAAL